MRWLDVIVSLRLNSFCTNSEGFYFFWKNIQWKDPIWFNSYYVSDFFFPPFCLNGTSVCCTPTGLLGLFNFVFFLSSTFEESSRWLSSLVLRASLSDVEVHSPRGWQLSARSVLLIKSQSASLFLPVSLSLQHPRFGSVRLWHGAAGVRVWWEVQGAEIIRVNLDAGCRRSHPKAKVQMAVINFCTCPCVVYQTTAVKNVLFYHLEVSQHGVGYFIGIRDTNCVVFNKR